MATKSSGAAVKNPTWRNKDLRSAVLHLRPGTAEVMASLHKLFFYNYYGGKALDTHFFSPSLTFNFC